jgi:predicted nucleic acid-binding protein
MTLIVVDTNVVVAATLRGGLPARGVVRACLDGGYQPLIGAALFAEMEDVFAREDPFKTSPLTPRERVQVLDGFFKRCRWVEVFYAWRPNLPDEGDNHLIELAVAGQAQAIVTRNLRDLSRGELKFPNVRVLDPRQCLEAFPPCPR